MQIDVNPLQTALEKLMGCKVTNTGADDKSEFILENDTPENRKKLDQFDFDQFWENNRIDIQIMNLEKQQTPEMLRKAALGLDQASLMAVNDQIETLKSSKT